MAVIAYEPNEKLARELGNELFDLIPFAFRDHQAAWDVMYKIVKNQELSLLTDQDVRALEKDAYQDGMDNCDREHVDDWDHDYHDPTSSIEPCLLIAESRGWVHKRTLTDSQGVASE